MKNNKKLYTESNRQFDYGIALLRMLMCFEVVLCHCWKEPGSIYLMLFEKLRLYAVPTFMILSFYLNQNFYEKKDAQSLKRRLLKLYIPQMLWAIIYFVSYGIGGTITKQKMMNGASSLFWQLFTGHSMNPPMWFQFELIIFTIFFFAVFYFCNQKVGEMILSAVAIFCVGLQYTGVNYHFFSSMRYELSYPLGRLAETMPMALIGYFLAKYNLLKPLKKEKYNILIGIIITVSFGILDYKLNVITSSFGYAGILPIGVTVGILMMVVNINFESANERIRQFIRSISRYTLGIYCEHILISVVLTGVLSTVFGVQSGKFIDCVLIYMISYFLSWEISKIPVRWIREIV